MSKQTLSSFFMLSPFTSKQAGFYQDLLKGVLSYPQLGDRLIRLAEQAHTLRQFDRVKECGQMLANMPLKPYQAIGYYFLGVAANSKGNGDQDKARRLLELVVSTAPDTYKVKSILSLGALAFHKRDFDSALRYFRETTKASSLSVASLQALRGVSILKAIEGDHAQAVKDFETILPIIRHAAAHIYFDLLNSYAVELSEVGRKDEAGNIMRVVLASPFVHAYPEWRETAEELRPARRSMVVVGSIPENILPLPEREPSEQLSTQPNQARVLNFEKLKKKMAKKNRDRHIEKSLENMSLHDMGFKLLGLITENRPNEHEMRTILRFIMDLFAVPSEPPDKPSA